MQLPYRMDYSERQRRFSAAWLAVFLALTIVAIAFDLASESLLARLGVLTSLGLSLILWHLYCKRLVRIVVDETSLVYSEPGWMFWAGPAKVLVFPYETSLLYIRWPHDKADPVPASALVHGADRLVIPDILPEYGLLLDHLRECMPHVDEEIVRLQGDAAVPLESGAVLRYGRAGTLWLLAGVLAVAVFAIAAVRGSGDSWPGFLLQSTVDVAGGAFIAAIVWFLGPRVRIDSEGLTYRFLWMERRVRFEDLDSIEFRDELVMERMTLRGGTVSITLFHPLSRYEDLVPFLEAKRPDLFPVPEVELPWVIECRMVKPWQQQVLLAVWAALACGAVYVINYKTGLWPIEPRNVAEFAVAMAPALLAGACYRMFRVRRFEFDEEQITVVRQCWSRVYRVKDLQRIGYRIKAMDHQRLVFEFREREFRLNASQSEMPLRMVLKTLHAMYPKTRQSEQHLIERHQLPDSG